MPFASPGLLVPLQVFLARVENPLPVTSGLVVEVAWLLVRLVFWFFFNGFLLHFLYFASLKSADADVLHRLDKWTLAGVLYLLGQFMTCKYAVIYGLPYLQARLDGMWAPTPPACIAYVYHYSDMWSYRHGNKQGKRWGIEEYTHVPVL
ncbi:hypothetical protein C0Q70_13081 [Pomacea canaliculata]|uniref:Uncharacterized protein n=1 Tax=Pomacea canaliculata TaxID=400727 RepID=A0A2T7NW76_POMCA|nr:hypothetical protein C0Q70_13081 [Pomacea canaliculata]